MSDVATSRRRGGHARRSGPRTVRCSIGPIPIEVRFSAPIHLGVEGSAEATARVDGRAIGTANFDVTCTKNGCSGSKTATFAWSGGAAPTGSVSGRADVVPYAYAGIHA